MVGADGLILGTLEPITLSFCAAVMLYVVFRHAFAKPTYKQVPLLTAAERRVWRAISGSIPRPYQLCPKVRLADLIQPKRPVGTRAGRRDLAKVWAKHIDIVVYDGRDVRAVLAIEIDDKSHDRKDRRDRDAFVNRALASANLPLLRIPLNKGGVTQARAQLEDFFAGLPGPEQRRAA